MASLQPKRVTARRFNASLVLRAHHGAETISRICGGHVTTIQHLEDQAARAERLAKRITDAPTVEKLLSFAGDRRREIEVMAARRRQV
jgi:hypothetical protein